jgi:peptide/nickel transport system substrate-binding protein
MHHGAPFLSATDSSQYASPAGLSMPWELLFAMDQLVFDERRAAYSDTAAARFNVPWLSLVMERDARLVERTLRGMLGADTVPVELLEVGEIDLVDPATAGDRYQAALDWFAEHGHLVISNGPYLLAAYDPPAQFAELHAFRDEGYPFRPGDWHFGQPATLAIDQIEVPTVSAGEDAEVEVQVEGPGELGVRYLLLDATTGELVGEGDAEVAGGDGRFSVRLGGELDAGLHRLHLAAHTDAVAIVVERSADLEVVP